MRRTHARTQSRQRTVFPGALHWAQAWVGLRGCARAVRGGAPNPHHTHTSQWWRMSRGGAAAGPPQEDDDALPAHLQTYYLSDDVVLSNFEHAA